MLTDTLRVVRPGARVQLRLTVSGASAIPLPLKFLGLSFCDSHGRGRRSSAPNRAAWGKTLPVPERIQSGYEGPRRLVQPGVAFHGAGVLEQACWTARNWTGPCPDVAAAVNDPVYGGTGNWPFNTAYRRRISTGCEAYVTRLDGIAQLEDWLAAGVPVVSVSFLLPDQRPAGRDRTTGI